MFFSKRGKSGNVAKDRLKLLLLAEHVECSPHTMQMLKNDMAQTAGKYFSVDSGQVVISFSQSPPVLTARLPLKNPAHSF